MPGIIKTLQFAEGTAVGSATSAEGTTSAKTADYTITDTDNVRTILMTTSSTPRTVTLPTAADNLHRIITVKKLDSGLGSCTIDGEGSELIDNAAFFVLYSQNESITVQSDGAAWWVLSKEFNTSPLIWQLNSWNPGGTGPSTTFSSAGSTVAANSAITVGTYASGVQTFTFNRPGSYVINVTAAHTHGATYGTFRMIVTAAGTATRYGGLPAAFQTAYGAGAEDSNETQTVSFGLTATSGQTLTMKIESDSDGLGATAPHTSYGSVMIVPQVS